MNPIAYNTSKDQERMDLWTMKEFRITDRDLNEYFGDNHKVDHDGQNK